MILHTEIKDDDLRSQIRNGRVCYAGNSKLKIFGLLQCSSGKRMKRENRVFFSSEQEPRNKNYRPCGHCMKTAYKEWKDGFIQSNNR